VLLSPHEQERLMLSSAAELARRRQARDAVRLPLPGGHVSTAWGRELHDTIARLAALDGVGARRVTAW
jgi:hypothetical protein